jgi:hypothetical protein
VGLLPRRQAPGCCGTAGAIAVGCLATPGNESLDAESPKRETSPVAALGQPGDFFAEVRPLARELALCLIRQELVGLQVGLNGSEATAGMPLNGHRLPAEATGAQGLPPTCRKRQRGAAAFAAVICRPKPLRNTGRPTANAADANTKSGNGGAARPPPRMSGG